MSSVTLVDQLDTQIAAIEPDPIGLKRHRNAATWTHRLPHDVLVEIFLVVQCSPGPHAREYAWTSYDCTWSRIMGVCYWFREAILQTPLLWSAIDLQNDREEWRTLCMRRASGALLCISGNVYDALDQLSRTRIANLTAPLHDVHPHRLDTPAPVLERLRLGGGWEITDSFLGGICMRLTHLILSSAGIVLQKGLALPTLRHLELQDGVELRKVDSLTYVVEHAPDLQTLNIGEVCITDAHGVRPLVDELLSVSARVSAPRLQTLTINAALAEASALARVLPLPAGVFAVTTSTMPDRLAFNSNHEAIHGAWVEFARSRPDAMTLTKGHVILHRWDVPIERLCAVQFYADEPGSHCVLVCVPSGSHPILDQIQVLHICDKALPLSSIEYEELFGLRFVPNIQALLLKDIRRIDVSPLRMEFLRMWVASRNRRIRNMKVSHSCDEQVGRLLSEGGCTSDSPSVQD